MSITATGLDRSALPAALLDIAKSHMRIDGTYDDAYIADAIKRAISWFERVTNVSVNPVTWVWSPGQGDFVQQPGDGAGIAGEFVHGYGKRPDRSVGRTTRSRPCRPTASGCSRCSAVMPPA